MNVYTRNKLIRQKYEELRIIKELSREIKPLHPERVAARVINLKREVRELCKEDDGYTIFACTSDSYTIKKVLPVDTIEEGEEWFEEVEYREPVRSQYDCTGCHFTWGHHIAKLHGDIVLYHHIAVDI